MLGPSPPPPPPPPPLTTPLARKAASAAATDASRGRSGWCSPMTGVGHRAGGAQRVRVLGGGSEAA